MAQPFLPPSDHPLTSFPRLKVGDELRVDVEGFVYLLASSE